jgi:hypothetical protein
MAARLLAEGHPLHALVEVPAGTGATGATGYEIRPLGGAAEIERYLGGIASTPVPFARPLAEAAVLEAVRGSGAFRQGAGTFLVISDGQSETLQSLSFLSDAFRSGKLFSTGAPRQFTGERAEIVPTALLAAWKETPPAGGGDFSPLDPRTIIPLQARPGLAVETFAATPSEGSPSALSFVTGATEGDEKARPLLTACGDGVGGPQELDPFADLRALATFFSLPFRREACVDHSVEDTARTAGDEPWSFRRQSLWVVPLSEEISGTLSSKGQFWIPRGYEPCCDALVYAAPLRFEDAPNLEMVRAAVQLEDAALPTTLILAPPPPEGTLGFPEDLTSALEDGPRGDAFVPVTEAADGTPLAYKARRARVAYVRTSLSLPNGELGRSSLWSQLWLGILADAQGASAPRIAVLQPASPADLETLPRSALSQRLDPAQLSFAARDTAEQPAPGLYRAGPDDARWTLVGVSPFERVESLLDEREFAALWSGDKNSPALGASEGSEASTRTGLHARIASGLALAALALIALWIVPWILASRRSHALRVGLLLAALGSAGLSPGGISEAKAQVQAQRSLRDFFFNQRGGAGRGGVPGAPLGIPMRIAWCDAQIPADVASRYERLRELLASRGTIELPKELLPGACRPGAAEIWWAADVSSLPSPALVEHVTLGGGFVLEGFASDAFPPALASLETPGVGLRWERQQRRGLLYRSFYLLTSFDGCEPEATWLLSLRKRAGAHSPVGIATRARFLSAGPACRASDDELGERSFVNLMYAFLTTDYKEDQLQLPEILSRVRNLGLEP